MPQPPITIGELTDVPAFDSPIASPWAQETSRRIVHRFATTAERDSKYPAATAGAGAVCAVAGDLYRSTGTRWIGSGFAGVIAPALTAVALGSGGFQAVYWNRTTANDPLAMLDAVDSRKIKIPYTGRWSITFSVDSSPAVTTGGVALLTSSNGNWVGGSVTNGGSWGGSFVMWLPGGEVCQCAIYNGGPVTNVNGGGLHVLTVGGV
jgi:hypothetical protein